MAIPASEPRSAFFSIGAKIEEGVTTRAAAAAPATEPAAQPKGAATAAQHEEANPGPLLSSVQAAAPLYFAYKTSNSLLNRVTANLTAYAAACKNVSSINDWLALNNTFFGSTILYTDEISTGLLFGYCAGYAFNRALRFGALLCGIGFISLQTLHHFGYIQVNWKRVEEDLRRPLDLNGDGRVDQEDVAALRKKLLKFMAMGVPSTAGLSLGLLCGLRTSR